MSVIEELGITFFFLVVGILVATRMKLPPVIGVLIAGAIIGPYGMGFVKQNDTINAFADIGATLLLFVIGIEFSISKIIKFSVRALMITFVKLAIVFIFVYETSLLLGFSSLEALVVSTLFSITSTIIFSKLIRDKTTLQQEEVGLLFAVLIIEDVVAIFILAFISSLANHTNGIEISDVVFSILKSLGLLTIAYLIVKKYVSMLFSYIIKLGDETVIFSAFAIAAIFALFANFIGLQPSIGAFLAGSLISTSKEFKRIEKTILPFGLFFSSFFFLSVGMLVSTAVIISNIIIIILITTISMATKFLSISISTYMLEKTGKKAILSGLAMLSIGEFSLLIAKESSKFMSFDIIGITASAVFLSSLTSAILIRNTAFVEDYLFSFITPKRKYEGRKTAVYISNIVREIEPGGGLFRIYLKETKKMILYTVGFMLLNSIMFVCYFMLENFKIIAFSEGIPLIIRTILHLLVLFAFIFLILRSLNEIFSNTIIILRSRERKNIELDKKIIYDVITLASFMLLFFIIPVIVTLLRLPLFFSHISVIPLMIGILILFDIIKTVHMIISSGMKKDGMNNKYTSKYSKNKFY